jgi:hypothetical protein
MRNIENKPDRATVDLTLNEFRILNNAMNEILNSLRIRGFRARVGATRRKTDILETSSAGRRGVQKTSRE